MEQDFVHSGEFKQSEQEGDADLGRGLILDHDSVEMPCRRGREAMRFRTDAICSSTV